MRRNRKGSIKFISSLLVLMMILSLFSPFVGQELVYAEEVNVEEDVVESEEELKLDSDVDADVEIEQEEVLELETKSELDLEQVESNTEISNDGLDAIQNYGVVPDPVTVYKAEGREALDLPFNTVELPSKYDLRDLDRLTPVKNQGNDGNCWAFGCYGSFESYLINEKEWDFSENHMKNTHGFDFEVNEGGNRSMSTAYLTRGSGPVLEENDPYIEGSISSDSNLPIEKTIKNVLYIPDREENSPFDNDRIKWAVMEYGGVQTSMFYQDDYFNDIYDETIGDASYAYYCDYTPTNYYGDRMSNHVVVIVGWDDDYPKENFLETPSGDGAFIVRNSWGDWWGDEGYFYVSYYDNIIGIENAVYIDAVGPNEFDNIYQYDELGWTGRSRGYDSETAWGANVFECKEDNELLSAVSFYTNVEKTKYEIYVNSNYDINSEFINGAKFVYEGTMDFPGYHTIDLPESIPLTKGTKFSVAIKYTTPGYMWPLILEHSAVGYSSNATLNLGESYGSADGVVWEDLAEESNGNVCIKAFTKNSADIGEEPIDFNRLPGGGHTIILGEVAYDKDYLFDNFDILIRALIMRKPMIIKLSSDVYIDQEGFMIEKERIPQIIRFKGFN